MLNNIKLTLEYDGTNYYGWQKQKGFKTIQGEIEEAIELVTKEYCEVTGSSRTDAGVHARGFVANFKTNSKAFSRYEATSKLLTNTEASWLYEIYLSPKVYVEIDGVFVPVIIDKTETTISRVQGKIPFKIVANLSNDFIIQRI